jgi:hypothetical protein
MSQRRNGFPRVIGFLAWCYALCAATSVVRAETTANDLLKFVPHSSNAVIVVRVKELIESPRGKKENWRNAEEHEILGGALGVPPWVELLVRAAHVSPANRTGNWTVSLVPRPAALSLETIIEHSGGTLETIGDKAVVRVERGYAAEIRPGVIGLMTPHLRQDFARWLRGDKTDDCKLMSEYLEVTAANTTAPIVIAYDLKDMLDPDALSKRLAVSQSLNGRPNEQLVLLKLLTQILGARMAILVDDKITAEMQLNFLVDVPAQATLLRDLLAEAAGDAGLGLPELEQAKIELDGKTVKLKMELSELSLRLILSLILAPVPQRASPGEMPSQNVKQVTLKATRNYFNSVVRLLTDLQSLNRRARDYNRTATWHDNFARRIRELSVVGVDPVVADFGATSASRLDALSASLRGIPVEINQLENRIETHIDVGWAGPWGFWSVDGYHPAPWEVSTNLNQIRADQQEAINRGASQRLQIWQALEADRISTRNAMISKFGPEFDPGNK